MYAGSFIYYVLEFKKKHILVQRTLSDGLLASLSFLPLLGHFLNSFKISQSIHTVHSCIGIHPCIGSIYQIFHCLLLSSLSCAANSILNAHDGYIQRQRCSCFLAVYSHYCQRNFAAIRRRRRRNGSILCPGCEGPVPAAASSLAAAAGSTVW